MENEPRVIIQGLWIGGELSPMEKLSIKSFLDNGHTYHLYTYSDVTGVPEGAIIKDGRDILPESDIFTYKTGFGAGSYSAFSNYFRYKLLLEKGGWWVDSDMICLKYWDFLDEYVFISEEEHGTGNSIVNSGAIKCPKKSDIMKYCWQTCLIQNKDTLQWGVVGPRLLGTAVKKFNLSQKVEDRGAFCMIAPFNVKLFIAPGIAWCDLPSNMYGLHLWNEAWKHFGIDKKDSFEKSCIYEQLKFKHGIE